MHNASRALVFLIGLCVVAVVLELGLRVAGFVYLRSRAFSSTASLTLAREPSVILCLGNSYTWGIGAPPLQSYPRQLKGLLDKKSGHGPVVVNGGRCNENTTELLDALEARIKDVHPDLVVLQTGEANYANFMHYNKYLRRWRRCFMGPFMLTRK